MRICLKPVAFLSKCSHAFRQASFAANLQEKHEHPAYQEAQQPTHLPARNCDTASILVATCAGDPKRPQKYFRSGEVSSLLMKRESAREGSSVLLRGEMSVLIRATLQISVPTRNG